MKKATSYLIAILAVASMFTLFAQREAKAGDVFQALRGEGVMDISSDGLARTCTLYSDAGVVWGTLELDFSGVNFQTGAGNVVATITRTVSGNHMGEIVVNFPFVAEDPLKAAVVMVPNSPYALATSDCVVTGGTKALSGVTRCLSRCHFEVDEMGLPVKCIDCLYALYLN